jgi:hypothetical protein
MSKRGKSGVWDYFTVTPERPDLVVCGICSKSISRGNQGSAAKYFTTSPMWSHLKASHNAEHSLANEKRVETEKKRKKVADEARKQNEVYRIVPPVPSVQDTLGLDGSLDRTRKYSADNETQMKGERLLAYWLSDALLPYTTVQNEQFVKLIEHFNKRFLVPSEKTVREKITPELYSKIQYLVKQALPEGLAYTITTDMWTSKTHEGYLAYTLHWITPDFKRKVAILRCMPYSSRHTGFSISLVIKNIAKDWGLTDIHCVVRDNASNISLGVRLSKFDGLGCFPHILHIITMLVIVCQSGVKSMRSRLRALVKKMKTVNGKHIFKGYQARAGVPQNAMILSGETRWKSEFLMMERAVQQKPAIKLAEDDENLQLQTQAKLTPNDWDLLPKVIKLLKPLYEATLAAEKETSCISDIIPLAKKIKIQVERVTESGIGTMKSELLKQLGRYLDGNDTRTNKFPNIELYKLTACATMLDPRYKMAAFKNKDNARRAKRILISLMEANPVEPVEHEVVDLSESQEARTIWDDVLGSQDDDSSQDETVVVNDNLNQAALPNPDPNKEELSQYLKIPRVDINSDPLMFWKEHSDTFPKLTKLACRYLGPPASSCASEREFKVSKQLVDRRLRLRPKNVEKLLFLKYNLRAIGFTTKLPEVPEDFQLPNSNVYELEEDDEGVNSDEESASLYSDTESEDEQ